MNERIRALALKCAQQLDWDPPADPKEYNFSDRGLNEFAELIVRECAHVGYNAAYPAKGLEVSVAIKQHFGIES